MSGDGIPESITTDRQLLEQILKNLLANAFKFTERGKVSLVLVRSLRRGTTSGRG